MKRPSLLLASARPTHEAARRLAREHSGIVRAILDAAPAAKKRWLLGFLRRSYDIVIVYVKENDPAADILVALSAFIPAQRRMRLWPDGTVAPLSRPQALRSLMGILSSSISAYLALLHIDMRMRIRRLNGSPHQNAGGQGILYVNAATGQSIGGARSHMIGVVNAFAARGIPVTAVCEGDPKLFHQDVIVQRLPASCRSTIPPEAAVYRLQQVLNTQLRRFVADRRPAAIYQRLTIGAWAAMLTARRHAIPFILEYNGSEVWISRTWFNGLHFPGIAARIEQACVEAADLIVTVSTPLRDELLQRGVPADRIVVASNGVDTERFASGGKNRHDWRRRHRIPDNAVVAAFVGSFGPWHGAPVLAEAATRISAERLAPELVIVFAGDGPQRSICEEILTALPDGAVRMLGSVDSCEIPELLAAADILVAPHTPMPDGRPFFGSPTKLFEYMAAGKAILASDLDQIGEVLQGSIRVNGIESAARNTSAHATAACGVLARPGDAAELVVGLVGLARHPALRDALGTNARHRAKQRHSWALHTSLILDAARSRGLLLC